MAAIDLTGQVFGLLTVEKRVENNSGGTAMWLCRCSCGQTRRVAGSGLRAGRNKSCGCASPKFTTERVKVHGMCGTRTYSAWAGIVGNYGYESDGGLVCERWRDFCAFLSDMGEAPDGMVFGRLDYSKGCEPGNCAWMTQSEQQACALGKKITHDGVTRSLSEWAELLGLQRNSLVYRLRRGWAIDQAVGLENIFAGRRHCRLPMPAKGPRVTRQQIAAEERRKMRARHCETCGTLFYPRQWQLDNGIGRYCSQKCNKAGHVAVNSPEAQALARQRWKERNAVQPIIKSGPENPRWTGGRSAVYQRRLESGATREAWHRRRDRMGGQKLPSDTVQRLGALQRWKCACCRAPIKGRKFDLDHVMPLALGGRHEASNLQLLCQTCNRRKHAKHPVDFMQSQGFLL